MRKLFGVILFFCLAIPLLNAAAHPCSNAMAVNWGQEYGSSGPAEDALWLLQREEAKSALLLKETRVHLEVTGALLHAEVQQVFFNHTDAILEVEYTFPLPGNATVTGMQIVTEDEVVTSIVQERSQARQTFSEATQSGRQAVLLEKDRSDVFTSLINRLNPGEEVVVHLNYIQPLTFEDGSYALVFPTTFGSRYFPSDWQSTQPDHAAAVSEQRRLTPSQVDQSENQLSLEAVVLGLPLDYVESPTHNLFFEEAAESGFQLEIDPSDHIPDRDVVLRLVLADSDAPQGRLLQSVSATGVHGLLQVFPPKGFADQMVPKPREVVFVIDTSGSMTGIAMEQAREGLQACLNMLQPNDRFNVVAYDDEFTFFKEQAVVANDHNLRQGRKFAAGLKADGGTELQKALFAVLNMVAEPTHLPMVVLLTDGDVGNEMSLLNLVNQSDRQTRFFSFGLGSAPNRYLLTKLGEVGGGFATFTQPNEDLAEVMGGFFESVNSPILTDVDLAFYNQDGSKAAVTLFPGTVPDLYLDRPIQVCYKSHYELDGHALVSGELNGQKVSYEIPLNSNQNLAHFAGVDKLYGKAWIDEMMVDYFLAGDDDRRERVRADIVRTALDYQLLSRFTSRVAVAKKKVVSAGPVMASVRVPLVRPASQTYPSTATSDQFWLLIGLSLMGLGLAYLTRQKLLQN